MLHLLQSDVPKQYPNVCQSILSNVQKNQNDNNLSFQHLLNVHLGGHFAPKAALVLEDVMTHTDPFASMGSSVKPRTKFVQKESQDLEGAMILTNPFVRMGSSVKPRTNFVPKESRVLEGATILTNRFARMVLSVKARTKFA